MGDQTPCLTGDLRTPGKRRAPQRHMAKLTAAAGSIPSPNFSSRGGATVTGVVIHTAEGPTDANALGAFFAQAKVQVSSHAGVDDSKRVNYVDPAFEAWTLRNGNPWTDNLEMCGFASWTRAQWLQHPAMIQGAAAWVAERCRARSIPPVRITAADIRAGRRSGYFAHWDYTIGTGDGTHWDVGTGFPWDIFGPMVTAAYNGTPLEDDMYDAAARAEVVGRLDTLIGAMNGVHAFAATADVVINDPTTGVRAQFAALQGKIDGLTAAIGQISKGSVDLAAVTAAADQGVKDAFSEIAADIPNS